MTQSATVSLSEFQRDADQHLQRLRASNLPEVLTVDGQPELVVQSAEGYQKLLESADMADSVRILRTRLGDDRGPGVPADTVLAEIRQRLESNSTPWKPSFIK